MYGNPNQAETAIAIAQGRNHQIAIIAQSVRVLLQSGMDPTEVCTLFNRMLRREVGVNAFEDQAHFNMTTTQQLIDTTQAIVNLQLTTERLEARMAAAHPNAAYQFHDNVVAPEMAQLRARIEVLEREFQARKTAFAEDSLDVKQEKQ